MNFASNKTEMEQTNGNGDLGYQMEVEVSSNSVDARGNFAKKSIHVVKERDKQLCNKKTDVDEDDDFFETDDLNEDEIDEEIDDEELEEDDEELIEDSKITPEYSSGAFLFLKTDIRKSTEESPIWRIDGKYLVRKYVPFIRDGKILHRSTSCYSGWNKDCKKYYYPVTVVTISETQKEHIVKFEKDLLPKEEPETFEECNKDEADCSEGQIDDDRDSLDDGEVFNDLDFDEDEKGDDSGKNENFEAGSFLVVKLEALEKTPPMIWKIDSKALLQKYVPCEGQDGQMYQSTNAFNGWSIKMKNSYYPAVVVSLEESLKKHIVVLKNVIRTE